jgi:hypothetical protein
LDLGCFYDNNNCYEKETSCTLYTDSIRCLSQFNGITQSILFNFYFIFFFYLLLFFFSFSFTSLECFYENNVCQSTSQNCETFEQENSCLSPNNGANGGGKGFFSFFFFFFLFFIFYFLFFFIFFFLQNAFTGVVDVIRNQIIVQHLIQWEHANMNLMELQV